MDFSFGRGRGRGSMPARLGGALFILFGLGWLGYFGNSFLEEKGAESWPRVEGKIESAKAYHSRRTGRRGGSSHGVTLTYSYKVDGVSYMGDKYYLHSNQLGSSSADDAAAELKVGSPVWVFYKPSRPATCCIVPGPSHTAWIPLAVGGGVIVAGAFFFIRGPRIDAQARR